MEALVIIAFLFITLGLEIYFSFKQQDRYFKKLEAAITNALINGVRK